MPDHKFEPFQRVLVRDNRNNQWIATFYSHHVLNTEHQYNTSSGRFRYCIPYTDETAHLLGTTQPYEPQKPPVEYEWGQKVEVLDNNDWCVGIYVHPISETARWHSVLVGTNKVAFIETNIRPLTDSAAR